MPYLKKNAHVVVLRLASPGKLEKGLAAEGAPDVPGYHHSNGRYCFCNIQFDSSSSSVMQPRFIHSSMNKLFSILH